MLAACCLALRRFCPPDERQAMVFRSIKLTFRSFDKPFRGSWRYLGYRPLERLTRSSHAGGLIRFSSTIIFPHAMFLGQAVRGDPLVCSHYLTPGPTLSKLVGFRPFGVIIGPGLKFYNLHQTLNTNINILKSFTDIYCISSARSGFVFFISFTSFFLTLII